MQLHPLQGNSGQLLKPKAFSKCQEASPHQAVSHHRYTFRAKITKPCRSVVSSGLRICALVKQLMGKILGTSSCSKNYMHKFGNKKTPSATTLAVKHIPSPIKVFSKANIFSPSHLLTGLCLVLGVPGTEDEGGQTNPMRLAVTFRWATARMKAAVPESSQTCEISMPIPFTFESMFC